MDTYILLQHYWWFIISLLGGILVFLLFVQGGNTLIFCLGKTEEERKLLVNATGRKWEFTFTTLVVFGGAFFASFPLFYSTSFGGAYWVWIIILLTFVLQAISYEFQSKAGNLLGKTVYRAFLVLNGVLGPLLIGTAVATFFTGSAFVVDKGAITGATISYWANSSHGLDALLCVWNVVLGLAVLFLARVLALLYFINTIDEPTLTARCRKQLVANAAVFVVLFLIFLGRVLLGQGYAVDPATGLVSLEGGKYLGNLLSMPVVLVVLVVGVVLVLIGIISAIVGKQNDRGIWPAGIGTVLTVLALLLTVGYGNTSYYPSTADLQSSLTLSNSCSSLFTLRVMAYVSILIPFVLAYIIYAWRAINNKKLTSQELSEGHSY